MVGEVGSDERMESGEDHKEMVVRGEQKMAELEGHRRSFLWKYCRHQRMNVG